MIKLQLKNKYYSLPACWNELTGQQLVAIMKLFTRTDLQLQDAQVKLFMIISGLSWWRMWFIGGDEINDCLYLTDFLLQENTLTKNILPKYGRLIGPADDFNNLQICEFTFTEMYYECYKESLSGETAAAKDLDMLISILYRPAKKRYDARRNPDGDAREVYNENLTAYYAKRVARWPVAVKLSILHWYEGCRQKLVENNPDVFGGSGGGETRYGLWEVMRAVAEKRIYDGFEKVERLHLKVFMMELNVQFDEANRIKQSIKATS